MDRKYVAAVDFGSSNLVMAVGTTDERKSELRVETLISRPSSGIEMGIVQNVNDVCDVLRDMKREIEEELGIRIEDAYAGVSGAFIHYHTYTDHVFVNDSGNGIVSQTDVDALNDRMNRVTVPEDEEVIDRFPLTYMLDNRRETDKPVGAFSRQLSSTFAFIVGRKQPLSRIQMVFRNAGLRLAGLFANSVVVSEAVLSPDEKNDGAAVIDIGADTTDVAVYSGGIVRYAATIPMGGRAIDGDINKHGVPMRNIEELKKQCGTAVSENVPDSKGIKIPTSGKGYKTIMKRNLAAIIEARLIDIIDYVRTEVKDAGYEGKLPYGVVITGGSAAIPEIDLLFSRHLGTDVRVAIATEGIDEESGSKIDSPEHTAAVALLLAGAAKGYSRVEVTNPVRVRAAEPDTVAVSEPEKPVVTVAEPAKVPAKEPVKGPKIGQATTYVPRSGAAVPPVIPPRKTAATVADSGQTAGTVPPVTPVVEPAAEKEEKKPVEKKEVPPAKPTKKRWGFGRFIDSLNGIFQDGADMGSFDDTSLNSVADESKRAEGAKPAFRPKSKEELGGFFVDGEDKEEI